MTSRYVCSSFYTAHRSSKTGYQEEWCGCVCVWFKYAFLYTQWSLCPCGYMNGSACLDTVDTVVDDVCIDSMGFFFFFEWVKANVIGCTHTSMHTHTYIEPSCWHSSSLASLSAPNSLLIKNRPPHSLFSFLLTHKQCIRHSTCSCPTENKSKT